MSKFEEQLLSDLMRVHGPELADTHRPSRRNTKPVWIAAGALVAAGAATGAFLVWPTSTPAYAVTDNGDGTVTVSVNNVSAVDNSAKGATPVDKCNGQAVWPKLKNLEKELQGKPKKSITLYLPGCPPQIIEIPGRK